MVGRSAAEFIKIMPGFAVAGTGTENRSNFSGENIGINGNGDGGSQSALNGAYNVNGLPTALARHHGGRRARIGSGLQLRDSCEPEYRHDPGVQSPDVELLRGEPEGSGGHPEHRQVRHTRLSWHWLSVCPHHSLNSNDWLNNRSGAPKPENKYFFPGGNIGGPVLIPGHRFNKNRDKLFFFTGYEHYFQTLDTGLLRATVPTEAMRAGNFSDAELRKIEGLVGGRYVTQSGNPASRLRADQFPGGIIPAEPDRSDRTAR